MIKRRIIILFFTLAMLLSACNQTQVKDVNTGETQVKDANSSKTQVKDDNTNQTPKSVNNDSQNVAADKDAEIKAYKSFVEKNNIGLFKPSYTAGYSFVEKTSFPGFGGSGTFSAWYKKGDSYFEVIGGLLANLGDSEAKGDGELFGEKYYIEDKIVIWWPKDPQGNSKYAYGINFEKAELKKEEIKKIIESFKEVK